MRIITLLVVLAIVLLSGCEHMICEGADRNIRKFESCIRNPDCMLNLTEYNDYDHYRRQQAMRCEGVER